MEMKARLDAITYCIEHPNLKSLMRVFHTPQIEDSLAIKLQHPDAIKVYHELNQLPVGPSIGNIETWQAMKVCALEMIIAAWSSLESLPIFDPEARFNVWEDADKLGYCN